MIVFHRGFAPFIFKEVGKPPTFTVIIFNNPKYRYVGDLTEIPYELRINSNYIYIFTIIDHFSKLVIY